MIRKFSIFTVGMIATALLTACATNQGSTIVDTKSVLPGTQVSKKGENLPLTGTAISIGQRLP
jgi:hypothetical protein